MARVFSGIQPSGELHIGNYLGAVQSWVKLQHQHDCLFCVVDLHAITQPYDAATLAQRTIDMAIGLFAAGIDPARAIVFVQSHVPEHTELYWVLNTVTPLGELERQTAFKDKAQRQESVPAGLLNYPILQAADVLLYEATLVPVGEDQLQHLELMREIARRWNTRFADGFSLPEPQALLSTTKRVLGLDGQAKMSKSLGNTIAILDSPETIWEKPDTLKLVAHNCRTAGWGCLDCKRVLADNMIAALTPIRERAQALQAEPRKVTDLLRAGATKASAIARRTMSRVRRRMGFLEGAEGGGA